MVITESTQIQGLCIVEYDLHQDARGALFKPYSSTEFVRQEISNLDFKEVWFTRSRKNVVRGMHFQKGGRGCAKIVSCIKGCVLDVVLDLRPGSDTRGKFFSISLHADKPAALYIPALCAHGYKVIEDDSIVMYMATDVHSRQDDVGIKWDSFGFDWSLEEPILSERDKHLPRLEEFM